MSLTDEQLVFVEERLEILRRSAPMSAPPAFREAVLELVRSYRAIGPNRDAIFALAEIHRANPDKLLTFEPRI